MDISTQTIKAKYFEHLGKIIYNIKYFMCNLVNEKEKQIHQKNRKETAYYCL